MPFYFDSLRELFLMDGHGPYVWAAFLITWITLIYLLVSPILSHRRYLRRQQQLLRREPVQNPAGRG